MKAADIYRPYQPRNYLRMGDRFTCIGNEYIIAQSSVDTVIAINLDTGVRLGSRVLVHNISRLTESEALRVICRRDITVTHWSV